MTKNAAAQALANKRWSKLTDRQKSEATQKARDARWPDGKKKKRGTKKVP
jgi:hypothetical protein